MTDLDFIKQYPSIEWSKPIEILTPKGKGWSCRLCIAHKGLKADETDRLFKNYGKFFQHLRDEHPLV